MDLLKAINDALETHGAKQCIRYLKKMPEFHNMAASDIAMIKFGLTTLECANGKKLKFKSITKGFGFCGRGKSCQCFIDKTKEPKPKKPRKQQDAINKKRMITNEKRYGVSNIGTSEMAQNGRQKFYSNPENIQKQVEKQETTMLARYGYSNFGKSPNNNMKVDNPMHSPEIASKSFSTRVANGLGYLNYDKVAHTLSENGITIHTDNYTGVNAQYSFSCICGHTWDAMLYYSNGVKCKQCNPTKFNRVSLAEQDVVNYVRSIYGGEIITSARYVIAPYEIDIFLPKLNIGIEYSGLYWHSANAGGKTENYHKMKFDMANAANVDLITIFSDNWNDQTKRIIYNKIYKEKVVIDSQANFVISDNAMGNIDVGWNKYQLSPTKWYTNYTLRSSQPIYEDWFWDCGITVHWT